MLFDLSLWCTNYMQICICGAKKCKTFRENNQGRQVCFTMHLLECVQWSCSTPVRPAHTSHPRNLQSNDLAVQTLCRAYMANHCSFFACLCSWTVCTFYQVRTQFRFLYIIYAWIRFSHLVVVQAHPVTISLALHSADVIIVYLNFITRLFMCIFRP